MKTRCCIDRDGDQTRVKLEGGPPFWSRIIPIRWRN